MNHGLNSVEIQKISITPLGEWSYLLKRHPPQQCAWPQRSDLLCWWCSHTFDNVPAFLPVSVSMDAEKGVGKVVFVGNFCSWNCVKRYAVLLETHRKLPDGCFSIGLLAYLTVCKGQPCEGGDIHELGLCDCMDTYRGVRLPESREMLRAFGGQLSIEEYRRGFHVITDYAKVESNFMQLDMVASAKKEALRSKNSKFWGFHYLHYAGPDASYTTYVNILPLTNRTFDKKTLVRTGNETLENARKLETSESESGTTATKSRRPAPPKGQRISRRGTSNKATSSQPVPLASIQPSHEENLPTEPLPQGMDVVPHATDDPIFASRGRPKKSDKNPPARIMTQEQVLACNDEQQFYTNSLRGFGNILTSMGIEISRPP